MLWACNVLRLLLLVCWHLIFPRVLWGKRKWNTRSNPVAELKIVSPKKTMIDVTRILLAGLKIESGIHKDWQFVCYLPTSLYLQHPTPANMGCVTERFFAWWKFYVTFCSCGFATPTVTVDGVMWHAAPGREYLTIIWTLLLHPCPIWAPDTQVQKLLRFTFFYSFFFGWKDFATGFNDRFCKKNQWCFIA